MEIKTRKYYKKTSTYGGVAMIVSIIVAFTCLSWNFDDFIIFISFLLIAFFVDTDDRFILSPKLKLLVETSIVALVILRSDFSLKLKSISGL